MWQFVGLSKCEISLKRTLDCGQVFSGVLNNKLCILREDDHLGVQLYTKCDVPLEAVKKFFRSHIDLYQLLAQWKNNDEILAKQLGANEAADFTAVRLLAQDPLECIFAFITSANNNKARISQLLRKFCETYGDKLSVDFENETITQYTFPTLPTMHKCVTESKLRDLGFGYRAKYIMGTIDKLAKTELGPGLQKLVDMPYAESRQFLQTLPGIGAKVADCICLYSLNKTNVIPIDVHINRAAELRSAAKRLKYQEAADLLAKLWGPYAGWAQLVTFALHQAKQVHATPKAKKRSHSKVT